MGVISDGGRYFGRLALFRTVGIISDGGRYFGQALFGANTVVPVHYCIRGDYYLLD